MQIEVQKLQTKTTGSKSQMWRHKAASGTIARLEIEKNDDANAAKITILIKFKVTALTTVL